MSTYILDPPPKDETTIDSNTSASTTVAPSNEIDIVNNEYVPDPVSQEESSGLQSARAQTLVTEKSETESIQKSNPPKVKDSIIVSLKYILFNILSFLILLLLLSLLFSFL